MLSTAKYVLPEENKDLSLDNEASIIESLVTI